MTASMSTKWFSGSDYFCFKSVQSKLWQQDSDWSCPTNFLDCLMASMGGIWKLWLPILLLAQLHQGQAENAWDGVISGLAKLDGLAFRDQVATPLVQMSANAYRFPDQACVDIPEWILSSKVAPVAPAEGGVHAQVYEEENGGVDGRIVVAFRGTQIGKSLDCDADLCADALLWETPGEAKCAPPSGVCDKFDDATLDYFAQAAEYVRKAIDAYPSRSLLLTGHSLGAGLAVLVSASLFTQHEAVPVIAFSAVGTRTALQVRNLTLDAEHRKRIIIIADQWDEVMRTSWNDQLGLLCLYKTTLNPYCKKCFDSPTCPFDTVSARRSMVEAEGVSSATNSNCNRCFLATHYLAKVIDTIQKGRQPACELMA